MIFVTLYVDASELLPHGAGVDLAHVTAAIRLLDLSDPKLPRPEVVVVRDGYAGVVRDDSRVKAQDGLVVRLHPPHLEQDANEIREPYLKCTLTAVLILEEINGILLWAVFRRP